MEEWEGLAAGLSITRNPSSISLSLTELALVELFTEDRLLSGGLDPVDAGLGTMMSALVFCSCVTVVDPSDMVLVSVECSLTLRGEGL